MFIIVGLFLLFLSVLIEALIFTEQKYWKDKKTLSFVAAVLLTTSSLLLIYQPTGWFLIVAFISIYKLINLARINIGRLPDKQLKSIALRTFVVLSLLQALVIILWQLVELIFYKDITVKSALEIFIVLSFICSIVIFISSILKIISSKPKASTTLSTKELPTVSVCIAARNETPTLTFCLKSVIESEYPKLEVLVLDDDSQDTTAEIIKSFALDGVRFIRQEKQNGDWLAKNNAYQTLLNNASGEIVMFMGVDVRLHKNTLNGLVDEFVSRDVSMMTVIPMRTKSGLLAAFIQPMRYWWELALSRFILKRKPALSTSWLAFKKDLDAIGGFKTYKRSIIPEEHLAKLFDNKNAYCYIRTTKNCRVTTHKDFMRQWDTSVRTRYPHAHRRPENVMFQSIILLSCVVLPFVLLPLAIFGYIDSPYSILITSSVLLYIVSHVLISIITNPVAGYLAPLNFPIAILLDIYAMHISMIKYEFSKVIWKGRDIAPKKLKVEKSLPKI